MNFSLVLLYVIFVLIFSFCLFCILYYDWRSIFCVWKCRKLPSARQFPIFGIGLSVALMKNEDLLSYFHQILKAAGDVMYYDILGWPHVNLMKPEDIELIFNNSQYITKGEEYYSLIPWLCEGLLTSTGKKWHTRRRMLNPAFHFKVLENYLPVFNKNANLMAEKIAKNPTGVDIDSFISLCTLDVILETVMGVSLNVQLGGSTDYVAAIRRATEIILARNTKFYFYNSFVFNYSPTGREFKRLVKELHDFTEKVIRERKDLMYNSISVNPEPEKEEEEGTNIVKTLKKYASGYWNSCDEKPFGKYKERKSFLDCLIEIQKENPTAMTDLDIREEVDTFMFEGHDTTNAALTWAMLMIATHPQVQERLHEEVFAIFGDSDREADFQDLNDLQYLEMVIKETLRLYPSVPYISRYLTTPVQIGEHVIPAGASVSIISYMVHRNEKVFEDPEKFDPDRFLPDNVAKRHPYAYIPFSAGHRNCIGQKFAMFEMKILLSTVLRRFRVLTSLKKDDIGASPEVVLRPSPTFHLTFSPVNVTES